MNRKPCQHPLMLVFNNLLIGTGIASVVGILLTGWFWYKGYNRYEFKKQFDLMIHFCEIAIVFGLALLPLVHVLVLLLVKPLTTHSIRNRIRPMIVIVIGSAWVCFLLNIGLDLGHFHHSFFGEVDRAKSSIPALWIYGTGIATVLIFVSALRMHALVVFSMPSNWMSIVPILISYIVLISLLLLLLFAGPKLDTFWFFYYEDAGSWPRLVLIPIAGGIVFSVFILVSGAFFPAHRRLAELWRPRKLPKIKPWPGLPAANGHQ